MDDLSRRFDEEEEETAAPARESAFGSLARIKINRQTARRLNQRGEDRNPGAGEQAILLFRGEPLPVRVVNISRGGAMIETGVEPFIGEPLEIGLGGDKPVQCVARWVGDGRIGLEFGSHSLLLGQSTREELVVGIGEAAVEPSGEEESLPPSEREPRRSVIRTGILQSGARSIPVRLCNISTGGVMLESEQFLVPGAAVRLDMAGGVMVTAKVRWNKGKKAGLSFDAAVDPSQLGSLSAPASNIVRPTYLDSEFDPDSPWAARFERLSIDDLSPGKAG
jgi:hypothetical protein